MQVKARQLLIKRRNIEYILEYTNATPFLWLKCKYRCFYCPFVTKDPDALRTHTLQNHKDVNLELAIFDRTCNTRGKDAATKIDVKDLVCQICKQRFQDMDQIVNHIIIAHDAEYDLSVKNCVLPFVLDKVNPTCGVCKMQFAFFEYLLRHANKNHLCHNFICDVCGTSFQGEINLSMHRRAYHKDGGYRCEYCSVTLTTYSKKLLHEKNVHLVKLSSCQYCSQSFKSAYLKQQHLANVHGVEEMKIKCPYCPKTYPQEGIMSRHMRRVHLRQKNVECEICGGKFFDSHCLKRHMVRHSGEKNYMCDICGKSFAKKSNLDAHYPKHDGVTYTCEICDLLFTNLNSLKAHMKNDHSNAVEEPTEITYIITSNGEIVEQESVIELVSSNPQSVCVYDVVHVTNDNANDAASNPNS